MVLGRRNVIDGTPNPTGGIITKQLNVTSAGTAQALANTTVPDGEGLVVKAKSANTGSIWIGRDAAEAQNHSIAFELLANQSLVFFVSNANVIRVDADVSGEGVNYAVEQ